jgi:hypothetical protein
MAQARQEPVVAVAVVEDAVLDRVAVVHHPSATMVFVPVRTAGTNKLISWAGHVISKVVHNVGCK